jgi:hypothetical protein
MAAQNMTDCRIYADAYDLSGHTNEMSSALEVAVLDKTTFNSGGWTEVMGGLKSSTYEVKGFLDYDAGQSEAAVEAVFASAGKIVTFSEDDANGSTCVFGRGLTTSLTRTGKVGDISMFSGSVKGSHPQSMVEGRVLRVRSSTSAASGNGTAVQVGALASGQVGYAALHVFSTTGDLVVKVESDNASNFPSTADRITFATASAAGAQWSSVAGPVTDDWWRISWTLSAGTASFAVVFGIA